MDNLARLRQARRKVVKVQRRIWLAEAMFWPAIALTGGLIAVAAGRWLQRRRRATTSVSKSRPVPGDDVVGTAAHHASENVPTASD